MTNPRFHMYRTSWPKIRPWPIVSRCNTIASIHGHAVSSVTFHHQCLHSRAAKSRSESSSPPAFIKVHPSNLIDEETFADYRPEEYYPVTLGEIFQDRYKIIGKLGYGSASTVWLCRDLEENTYIALKVYINNSKVHRELGVYQRINDLQSRHRGRDHVRKLLTSFEVQGPHGRHICLVHQPLGISLEELKDTYADDGVLEADAVREIFRHVIIGLQFLHEEAHVIHTGESSLR